MNEKKQKIKKKKRLRKFLFYSFLVLATLVVFFHVFLNTKWGQNITLDIIQKRLSVVIKWEELSFNGLTGRFEGKKLDITHLKNKSHITLEKFKFVLDPVRLVIFGQIHLTDINADNLTIDMSEFIPTKKNVDSGGKIHRAIATILRLFRAENGAITNISILLPDKAKASISKLDVKEKEGFSLFKHPLGWELQNIVFTSEKFDFFSDNFKASGSLEVKKGSEEKRDNIYFDGNLSFKNLLLGLNKQPIAWNTTPGFDESLNPVLQKFYGTQLPANRDFAHFIRGRVEFK